MRKLLFCAILVVLVMAASCVFAEVPFSDVAESHWAYPYIDRMQNENIINGYPDGTFRPDNLVKMGEFIKMSSIIAWGDANFQKAKEGEHWAMPYVRSLEGISYSSSYFSGEDAATLLDTVITRGNAVKIVCDAYLVRRAHEGMEWDYHPGEGLYQNYSDIQDSEDFHLKRAVDICTHYGIINGFEDGTFRPEASLTRAQATKIMSVMVEQLKEG